ncbi:MAG: mannonate dehydratase [Chloroflexota bacterium]|nr:mannonate dehydratase [Chloroflexota bacterium]
MVQATTAATAGQVQDRENVMRIAIGNFPVASDERLTFAKQMGLHGVVLNTPQLPATQRWEYMDIPHERKRWEYLDLVELRTRCENHGLRLEAIENVPIDFYDEIMLGLPGRDEQIANYQTIIRNMGAAGIPILGTTGCRTPSGAPPSPRRGAAVRSAPPSTWRWSRTHR